MWRFCRRNNYIKILQFFFVQNAKPKNGVVAAILQILCAVARFVFIAIPLLNILFYFLAFCSGYLYLGQKKKSGAAALLAFLLLLPLFFPLTTLALLLQTLLILLIIVDVLHVGSRVKAGITITEGECGIMAKVFKGKLWTNVIGERTFDSRDKDQLPASYKVKNPMV